MTIDTRLLLGRRPETAGSPAFGHVDVNQAGRQQLETIVKSRVGALRGTTQVPFHPDDEAGDGEVLVAKLNGFDGFFQPNATWSLERLVKAIRAAGTPTVLDASGIRHGGWSFYAIRAKAGPSDLVVVRAQSPTFGLTGPNKVVAGFFGDELKPIKEPLLRFDGAADLVVVGPKVYVQSPRLVERLFVDADAVKSRAGADAAAFSAALGAALSKETVAAIERVCSKNANIGRRVERLIRDGTLASVSAADVRSALGDAGLPAGEFGGSGPLKAATDSRAKALIDIAADLFYKPRFDDRPRRVASFRRL
jgi:hypothetical protein